MSDNNTIAASATASGPGGIAIIRVSGPEALPLLRELFRPGQKEFQNFIPNRMYYGHLFDHDVMLDECMAVYMKRPYTYTREDVAEFHLHGGSYTSSRVLQALIARGVRPAEPGEFTRRAFLNGRIDLSRAEAVMSLIGANGENAARAALRQMEGGPSCFIKDIQKELLELLAAIEAAIDYPDEIDETETNETIGKTCSRLSSRLRSACDLKGAKVLENGLDVVLCGAPNAGKSSLLNALLGQDRAIVTDIPGTTRDIVRESAVMNGIRVNFSDTAGIRDTDEKVEKLGIERTRQALRKADVILHLIDASTPMSDEDRLTAEEIRIAPHITLFTKSDLTPVCTPGPDDMTVSSVTGQGLDELKAKLLSFAGRQGDSELTQARHMYLASQAADHLDSAARSARENAGIDICSIDLDAALRTLGEITGDTVSEDLLDTIFSNFCVGK